MVNDNPFLAAFDGKLTGAMRWPQLDQLWRAVRDRSDRGWYVYAVGEAPPAEPVNAERLDVILGELDVLLRKDHDEDYCGIVYADDFASPSFIKVYDPNHLGSSCGASGQRVLPGWVLSTMPPVDLQAVMPPPGNRRRWWRRLFQ